MATLVRWEPFRELAQLQGDMGRLVNGLLEGQGRSSQAWVPAVDVWETDTELVYAFDLPGVGEEQLQIEVHDDTLSVSGERVQETQADGDRFFRFERRHGAFSRAVGLPQGIDEDKISASYENGVLKVTVPKPEEEKPRRIQLRGSAGKADIDVKSTSNDT